jgi:FkbM family methyltransferase
MKQRIKKILIALSPSARVQRLLEANVALSQYLMGIGSGSLLHSSGETVLIEELKRRFLLFKEPLTILDVGANQGQFLGLIVQPLQAAGIPFHVHAFEPGRDAYEILRKNFGHHANISLNNFGLGGESGDRNLFYDEAGSGLASLSQRRLEHFGIRFDRSEKVTIQVLDEYCAQRGIGRIDLLKLDVEGHELDVLKGASQTLGTRKIKMISFEFGGCNIDSRTYFQDFWYFFQSNGMGRISRILPSGGLAPIRQYHEANEQFRTTNFLVMQSETAETSLIASRR